MQLRDPLALLALIPVLALTVWAVRHTAAGHARWRLALGTALRVVLLLCLAAVLADLRLVRPNDERAVVFVVDASESVRPAARQHLLEWTRQAWVAHRPGDLAGLVVLGREARVEAPLAPTYAPADPSLEGWPRDRTALDRGLRLAGDLVRQHPGERRVVLLSDGNGDGESAAREAMALASAGIRLDTVAVELTPSPGEVLVGDVSAPPRATLGEPFLMKVELLARSGGPATLHVVRNGRYLEPRPLELAPGLNVVTLPQRLDTADVHVYQVSVEAAGDGNPANNAGGAVVRVRGRPRVLAVFGPDLDADGETVRGPAQVGAPLRDALTAAGFAVTVRGPHGLPVGPDELAGIDALVFGNVAAERWTVEQMEAVSTWVRDQGGGLVALGGERSFGQGGYYRTPIEDVLPVSSDVRSKKVLPSLALAFCVDRSGSMDEAVGHGTKLDLAKVGVVRTIDLLQPFDLVGVVAFNSDAEWAVPLGPVDDPAKLKRRVRRIESGGGTALIPPLDEAASDLIAVEAELKHVVLLTDGKSGEIPAMFTGLLTTLRRERISLTTVGVGAEVDRPLLEALAAGTGGRFLWTDDARTVPRLLTQEAVTATRALLIERPVVPRPVGELGRLGVAWDRAPPLLGFVLTVPKRGAEVLLDTGPEDGPEDGPILARWRAGLGKAVAFTSDATARWCGPWLAWPGYGQVLASAVRWAARTGDTAGFETTLDLEQESGGVRVEARGPNGAPLNGLRLGARVMGPAGAGDLPPLDLTQTAPGVYQAEFDPPRPGPYFVTVDAADGEARRPVGNAGAVLAYPREYRDLTADRALLARLAALGGGLAESVDDAPEAVFEGPREGRVDLQPVAGPLLTMAALLLLLEVVVRRLVLPEGAARALAERRAHRDARRREPEAAAATIATLRQHKEQERSVAQAVRSARLERASDRLERVGSGRLEPPATPKAPAPPPKRESPKEAPPQKTPPKAGAEGGSMAKLLEAKRRARGEGRS